MYSNYLRKILLISLPAFGLYLFLNLLFDFNPYNAQFILRQSKIKFLKPLAVKYNDTIYSNLILFGIPGDTIQIINGIPYKNSNPFLSPFIYPYLVLIDTNFYSIDQIQVTYEFLTYKQIKTLQKITFLTPVVLPKDFADTTIYPHSKLIAWNRDNFGPFIIPGKNLIIKLTPKTFLLYKPLIERDQNQKLTFKNGSFYLGNKKLQYYKFKNDYYFVLNKNLANKYDSRSWGPLTKKQILGRIVSWKKN